MIRKQEKVQIFPLAFIKLYKENHILLKSSYEFDYHIFIENFSLNSSITNFSKGTKHNICWSHI